MSTVKKPSASKQLSQKISEATAVPEKKKNTYVVGTQFIQTSDMTANTKQTPNVDVVGAMDLVNQLLAQHERGEIMLRVISVGPFIGTVPDSAKK